MNNNMLELHAANARIAELEAHLKVAQETIADLRDYNERAPGLAVEAENSRIAELEARLKEAEARIEQWVAQAKRADRAIADLEAENERLLDVEADAGRLRGVLVEIIKRTQDCAPLVATDVRQMAQAALRPAATGEGENNAN